MERSIEEIKKHTHPILPDSNSYSVFRCEYDENFESGEATLILSLRHDKTKSTKKIKFENVDYSSRLFNGLFESCGIYIMDTSHLGWEKSKKIEVGDWDSGPNIFWAESAKIIEE